MSLYADLRSSLNPPTLSLRPHNVRGSDTRIGRCIIPDAQLPARVPLIGTDSIAASTSHLGFGFIRGHYDGDDRFMSREFHAFSDKCSTFVSILTTNPLSVVNLP